MSQLRMQNFSITLTFRCEKESRKMELHLSFVYHYSALISVWNVAYYMLNVPSTLPRITKSYLLALDSWNVKKDNIFEWILQFVSFVMPHDICIQFTLKKNLFEDGLELDAQRTIQNLNFWFYFMVWIRKFIEKGEKNSQSIEMNNIIKHLNE